MERTLDTISVELEGLAAITNALAIPFWEEDVPRINDALLGKALGGIALYIERLTEDVDAIQGEALKRQREGEK